uniref:Uncharacterized protein n=1 Tax=Rhizophora mucronata TaxID=61149 RepID=A0A2P2NGL5_RHIMU
MLGNYVLLFYPYENWRKEIFGGVMVWKLVNMPPFF